MGVPYKTIPNQKQKAIKYVFMVVFFALLVLLIGRFFINNGEELRNVSIQEPSGVSYLTPQSTTEDAPVSPSDTTDAESQEIAAEESTVASESPSGAEESIAPVSPETPLNPVVESFQYIVPTVDAAHHEKVDNATNKFFSLLGIFTLVSILISFVFMKSNFKMMIIVITFVVIMAIVIRIVSAAATAAPKSVIEATKVKESVGYADYQNNEFSDEFIDVKEPIAADEALRVTLLNSKNHRLYDFDVTAVYVAGSESELVVTYTNMGYTTSNQALAYYFKDGTTSEDYARMLKEADDEIIRLQAEEAKLASETSETSTTSDTNDTANQE